MTKKRLLKQLTALTLSFCLAASPAVIYAAEDAVEVFAQEETATADDGYADEGYADEGSNTEEVYTEEVFFR